MHSILIFGLLFASDQVPTRHCFRVLGDPLAFWGPSLHRAVLSLHRSFYYVLARDILAPRCTCAGSFQYDERRGKPSHANGRHHSRARDSRCSGVSQTHARDCQARLHLQLRHLSWLRLSHPITVWDYYRTADTRLCTYARMRTPNPCLIRHQPVYSYPHTFGPSNSCPLLTGQTACGAELKR